MLGKKVACSWKNCYFENFCNTEYFAIFAILNTVITSIISSILLFAFFLNSVSWEYADVYDIIKAVMWWWLHCFQDVAALESQPLLGFFLREEKTGPAQKMQFKLYHKNTLYYIFRAEDIPTAQRYTKKHFMHLYRACSMNLIKESLIQTKSELLFQMDRSVSRGHDPLTGLGWIK